MITSNLLRKLIQKLLRNSNASYPVSPEQVQKINRILVVGAGTMGTQIAVQCASHGRLVFLYDNIRAVMEQAPARLERLAQGELQRLFLENYLVPANFIYPNV